MENRDFEENLGQLKPANPSARLKQRLAVALADEGESENSVTAFDQASIRLAEEQSSSADKQTRTRGKIVWGTTFTALVSAIAAVWTVILVLDYRAEPSRMGTGLGSTDAAETASFTVGARPIDQYAVLVGATPSPVYYLEDGTAVQQVALRYLDTEVWEVDDSEETFTVSSYREEIRTVPVESF